jgi:hypothetical protein
VTPGDPVVGGTVLRRAAIQSPDYVEGVSGWTINADGSAEFNDVTIRGSLVGTTNFSYSGTPAAGNLVQTSGIVTPGTDGFGNNYLAGDTTYGATFAASLDGGFVQFYTGSLAGGWTQSATIETDSSDDLILACNGSGSIQLDSAVVFGAGGATGTGLPAGSPTGGPNSGTFAGHTHDFDGHTHDL